MAKSGRPGPVVIDVPKNVQEQDLDDDIANLDSFSKLSFNTPGYNPTIKGNPRQVKKSF
nr:hypothetical protein [Methanobrevibacter arboriphilus]